MKYETIDLLRKKFLLILSVFNFFNKFDRIAINPFTTSVKFLFLQVILEIIVRIILPINLSPGILFLLFLL